MLEDVTRPRAAIALALAALTGLGCASGSRGTGSTGETPDAGHPDAGHPDAGPPDAGPTGDALPPSAVSFFQGGTCPMGWAPYTAADGFFMVPTVATAPPGLTHGQPLASGEDRTHTHDVSASFPLNSTGYAEIGSCCNNSVGKDGTVSLKTTSSAVSTGLPYVQLLVCRKNAAAVPGSSPLPKGLQMFFDMTACPVGWKQTAATQGRLIVGLPQDAPQDVTFGGPALSSGDAGADTRTHGHGGTATLATTSQSIVLASGSGSNAANGTYNAALQTSQEDVGLPYIELLACEVQ